MQCIFYSDLGQRGFGVNLRFEKNVSPVRVFLLFRSATAFFTAFFNAFLLPSHISPAFIFLPLGAPVTPYECRSERPITGLKHA